MKSLYHHIAYAGFEVANPTRLEAVLALATLTGLGTGATALDIGAGAGGVSCALAARLGLSVHAIERDPVMAGMIRERVRGLALDDRISVVAENSATVLETLSPTDLIVALGTTEAAAPGVREPSALFEKLAGHLGSPGWILWGDLFWKGDPPAPLRQIIGMTGDYATHPGWQEAATTAGLEVVAAEIAPDADWDAFFGGADAKVRDWLEAHPDDPEAASIRARADQIRTTFEFGRPFLGFGLYLFRKA